MVNEPPKRGEIYYIFKGAVGSEIDAEAGRPGIVVSNERNNRCSNCIEVVFLTTRDKPAMPTHVEINSTGVKSTALCEQIHTVSVNRVGRKCGECSEGEIIAVDYALMCSLGLDSWVDGHGDLPEYEVLHQKSLRAYEEMQARYEEAAADARSLKAELNIYKTLYHDLLDRLTIGRFNP